MSDTLSGRRAFVTGADSGIGRAIALGLAQAGADVVVHHLGNTSGADKVVAEIEAFGRRALTVEHDLTRTDALPLLVETLQSGPHIDILILNAAIEERAAWTDLDPVAIDRHVAANFTASLMLAQALVPSMSLRSWGRIVALGSILASRPRSETLVYASLKSAQLTALRSIARTVAAQGVTANVVSPGSILTGRSETALSDDTTRARVEAKIPMRRIGVPQDCVAPVLMLCSDAGGYITGADIPVDGGWHIGDALEVAP